MTTTIGRRLSVLAVVEECDRYPHHEVTVVSDGTVAVAYGAVDTGPVSRDGVTLTAPCGQPHGPGGADADPCEGTVTWRMDTPLGWTALPAAIDLLERHGVEVQR